MKLALTALLFAAGCLPAEGGIEFNYGIFRDGSPLLPGMNCTAINVTRIRLVVGNDKRLIDETIEPFEDLADGQTVIAGHSLCSVETEPSAKDGEPS